MSATCDMLLIVGDLFDSSRISEGALGFALAEIARAADAGRDDPRQS